MPDSIQRQVFAERRQAPSTRVNAIKEVETHLGGRTLVTFFTSFDHPLGIDDNDCDMLQSILQHIDTTKGLALMINSPGGMVWRLNELLTHAAHTQELVTTG